MITKDDVLALKKKYEEWANIQEQDYFIELFMIDMMIDVTVKKYDELDCWDTPEAQNELGAMKRCIYKIMGEEL